MMLPSNPGPIGIFDSGYGGLTILHGLRQMLPQYDYMYLGDNARAPYGSRSFEVVYKFTRRSSDLPPGCAEAFFHGMPSGYPGLQYGFG